MHRQTDKKLKEIYNGFSESTKPIHKAYLESINALVRLAEMRDPYTKGHSLRVSKYAALLAKYMRLAKSYIETIKLAGLLHDVGKIGIRENVLVKRGSLTKGEYDEVKKHAEFGVKVVRPLRFFSEVIPVIKYHHENYDGTGYPEGLKGEDIPLGARILSIADVYEALTSTRAYRKAYLHEQALEIMTRENGKKFDPALLKAFMACLSSRKKC